MRKINLFSLVTSVFLTVLFLLPAQAALLNQACSPVSGCTANDIGVQDIVITFVDDGCTGPTDTARVKMEITATSSGPNRYDIGMFINTAGEDTANINDGGTQCLHEALFEVGTPVDNTSGFGPYLDNDTDKCGDLAPNTNATRTISDSDIGGSNQPAIFQIGCADNDANGYVDFAWLISYAQNAGGIDCQSIADAIAGTKSKCKEGISDSAGTAGSIPIGLPDLSVSISCTPVVVDVGDVSTCTVTYNNASSLGAADNIKFRIDYPETYGTVSNISTSGGETGTDSSTDIVWEMSAGTVLQNISPLQTNTMTFDFTYNGGLDFPITIETYYDNGTTETAQDLNATEDFTTLPVTIAYVNPQESGEGIDVDFTTASETSNIGFNIYAVKGKKWTKLNEEIIPGALDSFEPKDYSVSLAIPSDMNIKKIGIAGINASGSEDRHGPFKIGRESGEKVKAVKVDWKKVRKQVKADRKAKRAAKKAARKATKTAFKDQNINLNITKDGVYRITHDELLEAGINLNGQKSEKIAISLRGEGVARHVQGTNKKDRWTNSSVIEFIGTTPKGADALYLDTNLYQLSLNKKLAVYNEKIESSMMKTEVFEANNRYAGTLPGDDPFYDEGFYARGESKPGTLIRNFEMPKLVEGTSAVKVNLTAYTFGSHEVNILLNDVQIASESIEGNVDWPIEVTVNNNIFIEGTNKITLNIPGKDDIFDYLVYDKLAVTYDDGKENESMTASINLTDKITRKSIRPKRGINYIIISHPLFISETLDRYVTQREGEGWKIKVVNVEDIYDVYGYGMATPDAIKDYLRVAKKNDVSHVQLVGAANYDYHDYLKTGAMSFIPSIYALVAKTAYYTPCDSCFVSNEDGVPELAIGRWPVRTLESFEAVVNKTLAWETTGQSATHTALFIADETDKGMNFGKQMEETAQQFVQKDWQDLTRVYLDDIITDNQGDVDAAVTEARSEIKKSLENGASITSYSGHSSPSLWSFKGLFNQSDIATIDNVGKTTMALPLACFATYADSPYINTIAHQFLAAGENGAVAIYGASTTSYYGDNGVAINMVIDHLLEGKTIGMAVKEMKQSLGTRYIDVIRSGLLQGDVTLKLK